MSQPNQDRSADQNRDADANFSEDRLKVLGGFVEHTSDHPDKVLDDMLKGADKVGVLRLTDEMRAKMVTDGADDFSRMLAKNLDRDLDLRTAAAKTFLQCYSYLAGRAKPAGLEGSDKRLPGVVSILSGADADSAHILSGDLAHLGAEYRGMDVAGGIGKDVEQEFINNGLVRQTLDAEMKQNMENRDELNASASLEGDLNWMSLEKTFAADQKEVSKLSYQVLRGVGGLVDVMRHSSIEFSDDVGKLEDFMINYQHKILDDKDLTFEEFRDFFSSEATEKVLAIIARAYQQCLEESTDPGFLSRTTGLKIFQRRDQRKTYLKGGRFANFQAAYGMFTTAFARLQASAGLGTLKVTDVKIPEYGADVVAANEIVEDRIREIQGITWFCTEADVFIPDKLMARILSLSDLKLDKNTPPEIMDLIYDRQVKPLAIDLLNYFESNTGSAELDGLAADSPVHQKVGLLKYYPGNSYGPNLVGDYQRLSDPTGVSEATRLADDLLQTVEGLRQVLNGFKEKYQIHPNLSQYLPPFLQDYYNGVLKRDDLSDKALSEFLNGDRVNQLTEMMEVTYVWIVGKMERNKRMPEPYKNVKRKVVEANPDVVELKSFIDRFKSDISGLREMTGEVTLDVSSVHVPKFSNEVEANSSEVATKLRKFSEFLDSLDQSSLPDELKASIARFEAQLKTDVLSLVDSDPSTNPTPEMLEIFIRKHYSPLYAALQAHFEAEAERISNAIAENNAALENLNDRLGHLEDGAAGSPVLRHLLERKAEDLGAAQQKVAAIGAEILGMENDLQAYEDQADAELKKLNEVIADFDAASFKIGDDVTAIVENSGEADHSLADLYQKSFQHEADEASSAVRVLEQEGEKLLSGFASLYRLDFTNVDNLTNEQIDQLIKIVENEALENEAAVAFQSYVGRQLLGIGVDRQIGRDELVARVAQVTEGKSKLARHLLDLCATAILKQAGGEIDAGKLTGLVKRTIEAKEASEKAKAALDDFNKILTAIKNGDMLDYIAVGEQVGKLYRVLNSGLVDSGYVEGELLKKLDQAVELCRKNASFGSGEDAKLFLDEHWDSLSALNSELRSSLAGKYVQDLDATAVVVRGRQNEIDAAELRKIPLEMAVSDLEGEPIEMRALRAAGYDFRVVNGQVSAWGRKLDDIKDKDLRADLLAEFEAAVKALKAAKTEGYKGVKSPAGALKTLVKNRAATLADENVRRVISEAELIIGNESSIAGDAAKLEGFIKSFAAPTRKDSGANYDADRKEYARNVTALTELHRILADEAKQAEALYEGMTGLLDNFRFAHEAGLTEGIPDNLDKITADLAGISDRKGNFTESDVAVLAGAYDAISGHIDNRGEMARLTMGLNNAMKGIKDLGENGDKVVTNVRAALINLGYPELSAEKRAEMLSSSLKLDRTAQATKVDAKAIAERATAPVVQAMQNAAFAELHKSGKFEVKRGGKFVPLNRVVVNSNDLVQPSGLRRLIMGGTLDLAEAAALYVAHKEAADGGRSAQCFAIHDAIVDKILESPASNPEGKKFSATERVRRADKAVKALISEQENGGDVKYYFTDYQPEISRKREKAAEKYAAQQRLLLLKSRDADIVKRKHFDREMEIWENTPKDIRGPRPSKLDYRKARIVEGGADMAKAVAGTVAYEGALKGGLKLGLWATGRLANLGARFISGGRWNPQKPKELSKLVHLSVGKTFGWIHEKARQSSDHSVEVETLETKIKAASEKIDADPNKIQVDGSKVDIASFFQGEVKEEKKEAA